MANVRQPATEDSIKVRQLTHYQFSWVAGDPGKPGTYTLQLVLDEGAWRRSSPWTPTTPTTSRPAGGHRHRPLRRGAAGADVRGRQGRRLILRSPRRRPTWPAPFPCQGLRTIAGWANPKAD
jgi:hypothetical protein